MKTKASEKDRDQIEQIIEASHPDPFGFLGLHQERSGLVIRVFRPSARAVFILVGKERVEAEKVDSSGFFVATFPKKKKPFSYEVSCTDWEGEEETFTDPYSFGNILGEEDLHYLKEGKDRQLYRKLGANFRTIDGVDGILFAVWAPNAQRVSVVGDFNRWDGRILPMKKRIEAGVWELFIPGIAFGTHYKFEMVGADGRLFLKSDPCAFFSQNGSETASITWDIDSYEWKDDDWMAQRNKANHYNDAVSIYEVHLGSWARKDGEFLTYRDFAEKLVDHVKELGFTHIELMPITEFPFDGSWGYQVCGYFAPTSRFGNPDDFRYFVDVCHRNGIGVILDWVPAHFPKDDHGLARFDGTPLYEHTDPREGEHKDWGTLIFNFGRNEVRNFLIANALFWFDQYHLDGIRVDAVASLLYRDYSREEGEWVPNKFGGRENIEAIDFLREMNEVCYAAHPGIMTLAEESTAWGGVSRPTSTGGLGFGYKWNMGWMHDFLVYMAKEPVHRKFHHGDATFAMIYAYDENFVLVLSHDEVVHGKESMVNKMPGDRWQKFANLRMFYAWMFAHPGKKLLFMGAEFGQTAEWNYEQSLDWHLLQYPEHKGLQNLIKDLNSLYKNESALHEMDHDCRGFQWIDHEDAENSTFSFIRRDAEGNELLVLVNATPVPRENYRVGVPNPGFYREVLNSDSDLYAGENIGNYGGTHSEEVPWQGQPVSITVNMPPLATLILKRE